MRCGGVTPSIRRALTRRSSSLLFGALLVTIGACKGESQLHGVMVDPPRAVSAHEFTLPDGARFSTAAEAERPLLVFFGYTHCPDVCPTTLADWKRAKQRLGRDAERVRFVFVTVDPDRDTPALAERYAKQFDAAFVGVSGDSATTRRMLADYGVSAAREASPAGASDSNYFVSHSSQVFLVDGRGRILAIYPFGIGWEALAADLETVL